MKPKPLVGVWLDHRKAIMFWTDREANMEDIEIKSGYQEEGEPSDSRGKPDDTSHSGSVPHASVEQRREEQLKHFYKKLNKKLHLAEQIYLFGPGPAKKELANHLKKDKSLNAELTGIKGADKKMTRPQMAAHVREVFGLPNRV